ncbi:MAG: TMEM43 family protein, partial [Lentisphaeria bacterium]
MSEEFTEVTNKSWFSRIADSIKAIVVGLLLFAIAFPVLWFNEGRAVNAEKRINYAKDNVVSVANESINNAYEGRLVHIIGKAVTSEILSDKDFQVAENAIKLTRHVEMYQWIEVADSSQKKELGGNEKTTTSYSYEPQWQENLIISSSFKDKEKVNP